MEKIYIVIDCCSGEDYTTDDPTILFVGTDEKKAKAFFDDEISKWEDEMTNFDTSYNEGYGEIKFIYECTDFDGDSHRIMKLVEKELEK